MISRTMVLPGTKIEMEGCPRPSSRILVAYHEAGHAVVAAALGVPFDSVTIVPRDGSL
jgi:ATP-dependent Zn protease